MFYKWSLFILKSCGLRRESWIILRPTFIIFFSCKNFQSKLTYLGIFFLYTLTLKNSCSFSRFYRKQFGHWFYIIFSNFITSFSKQSIWLYTKSKCEVFLQIIIRCSKIFRKPLSNHQSLNYFLWNSIYFCFI